MNEEARAIEEDIELAPNTEVQVPIPDVEIEVVDDRPQEDQRPPRQIDDNDVDEEIEGIGERTKKRIDKLKFDYHEERRKAEAAQKVGNEAATIAKQLHDENQKLKATVAKSEDALLSSLKTKTSTEIESAKTEYKTAYESGDTDKLLQAQEKLSAAYADKSYVENYQPTMQTPVQPEPQQQYAQPQYAQPMPQQQVQIDPAAAEYIRNNPWFERAGDEDMTALAYGMHSKLVREGVDPIRDSDVYYSRVDEAVKQRFPERFEDNTASSQRPSTVVARLKLLSPRNLDLHQSNTQRNMRRSKDNG